MQIRKEIRRWMKNRFYIERLDIYDTELNSRILNYGLKAQDENNQVGLLEYRRLLELEKDLVSLIRTAKRHLRVVDYQLLNEDTGMIIEKRGLIEALLRINGV